MGVKAATLPAISLVWDSARCLWFRGESRTRTSSRMAQNKKSAARFPGPGLFVVLGARGLGVACGIVVSVAMGVVVVVVPVVVVAAIAAVVVVAAASQAVGVVDTP